MIALPFIEDIFLPVCFFTVMEVKEGICISSSDILRA